MLEHRLCSSIGQGQTLTKGGSMKAWKKVPSVMTGGMPFFYVRYDRNTYPYSKRQSVVWDRQKQAWAAQENDKTIGYYDNLHDAQRAL